MGSNSTTARRVFNIQGYFDGQKMCCFAIIQFRSSVSWPFLVLGYDYGPQSLLAWFSTVCKRHLHVDLQNRDLQRQNVSPKWVSFSYLQIEMSLKKWSASTTRRTRAACAMKESETD